MRFAHSYLLTKVFHLAVELYGVAHFGPVDLGPTPELRGEPGGGPRAPRAGEAVRDVTSAQEYPDKRCEDGGGDAAAEAADFPAAMDCPKFRPQARPRLSATPRRPHLAKAHQNEPESR